MTDRSEVINDATAEPPVPAPGGGAGSAAGRGSDRGGSDRGGFGGAGFGGADPGSATSGRGGQPARVPAQRGGGSRKGRTPGADGSIPVPPRAAGTKLVPAPPRVEIPPEHLAAIRSATASGSLGASTPGPGVRGSGPAGSRGAGPGGGRGPGGGKRGKARKGTPVPLASAETAQIPAVAAPERLDDASRPAIVDDEAGSPKRDKGKHAAETGIFPAITAEALAAEALAAAVALDAPPAGAPDPFTQPTGPAPTGFAPVGGPPVDRPPTGYLTEGATDEQPLVGAAGFPAGDGAAASSAELPAAIEVPGDDSPTVADYVPALAIVAVDEATDDDDDNHYRGARRRRSGGRRYPIGALVVMGVIVVIMGVVAVQLFSGNTRTPVAADDTTTGTAVTPNLAVPPPDSPSAVDSPSVTASATRSHAAATTKAVVPVAPVSQPASPAAPTSPAVTSRSGSLSMVSPANRCATVGRGGTLVLGGCGQTFTMPGDGTVQMRFQQMGTFCLDLSHGSTANRTPVVLQPCNGSGTQKWAFGGNNALKNSQAGRCFDAEGGSTQDDTRLIIWDCSGNANQQWRLG